MAAPSMQSAERCSTDADDGTPIGATVVRVLLPDDLTRDAAGLAGPTAQAAARAAIGEAVGEGLRTALDTGALVLP